MQQQQLRLRLRYWYEAAVEAGLAAGKAAKAANQVEEAALSPLVVALAADEILIHEFDIPVMGETAAKAANVGVQRKSRSTERYEVSCSGQVRLQKMEKAAAQLAVAQLLQAPRPPQPM